MFPSSASLLAALPLVLGAAALTGRLADAFENRHFAERLGSGGLEFDYQLRPGPAQTTNALELLAFLGYPPQLVAEARSAREEAAGAKGWPDRPGTASTGAG